MGKLLPKFLPAAKSAALELVPQQDLRDVSRTRLLQRPRGAGDTRMSHTARPGWNGWSGGKRERENCEKFWMDSSLNLHRSQFGMGGTG